MTHDELCGHVADVLAIASLSDSQTLRILQSRANGVNPEQLLAAAITVAREQVSQKPVSSSAPSTTVSKSASKSRMRCRSCDFKSRALCANAKPSANAHDIYLLRSARRRAAGK